MGQFVTRIDTDLEHAVDRLVDEGVFDSRSEAVRTALAALVDLHRRRKIGERMVEGYLRFPETEEEMARAHQNALDAVNEEPWNHETGRPVLD